MAKKITKIVIAIAVIIGLIISIIIGVKNSDFSNIKKYDQPDKAPERIEIPISDSKKKFAKARYYTTQVTVSRDGDTASLGDFTMNVANNKKLIANISLKFKQRDDAGWFETDASTEIMEKGIILRDATIDTLTNITNVNMENEEIKANLKQNLNSKLKGGEIEEIYFNKFIVQ